MSSPLDSTPLASLCPCVDRFVGRRILVWGDLVADRFLCGTTTRVSREAPALVLRYEDEEIRPGGAGNAALNAAALGASVTVFGYLGSDNEGSGLRTALQQAGIDTSHAIERSDGSTPVKTRVMAGGLHTVRQQILRIDHDRPWRHDSELDEDLVAALRAALVSTDGLLISDYGLGAVSASSYARLATVIGGIGNLPVTLDSRFDLLRYRGVTAATPNEAELEHALGVSLNGDPTAIEEAGRDLQRQLEAEHLLITRGSYGMTLLRSDRDPVHLPIHGTDQIADVTGAGDTVIATLTLALAAGASVLDGARIANIAAGLVVMKHGTAAVPREELLAALRETA